MIYCEKCGAPLDDDAIFCLKCGASVSQESGDAFGDFDLENEFGYNPGQAGYADFGTNRSPNNYGDRTKEVANQLKDAAKKAAGVAADAVKANVEQRKLEKTQVNQSRRLVLAEGETLIRTYNVTKVGLIFRTNGRLTVTNKRLLFTSSHKKSKVFMSTPIDSVGSIDIITGRNILLMIYGILLILTILCIIPGIILLRNSKSMFMSISATNSSPGMVIGQSATGGKASNAVFGDPGVDVPLVMSELGAMILDLQQFGDNAIEKWKK